MNLFAHSSSSLLPGDFRIAGKGARNTTIKRAVFIDLDGTLWPDLGPGSILRNPIIGNEVVLRLSELSNVGYLLIGITNQTYFGYRRRLNPISIFRYRSKMRQIIRKGILDLIYVCHHHPESKLSYLKTECTRRKPNSGLIEWAKEEFDLELDKSIVIGDRITDIAAGQKSGIAKRFLIANPRCIEWNISRSTTFPQSFTFSVFGNLIDALEMIKNETS